MTSARENTSCDLVFASRVGNRGSQFSKHKLFNERIAFKEPDLLKSTHDVDAAATDSRDDSFHLAA